MLIDNTYNQVYLLANEQKYKIKEEIEESLHTAGTISQNLCGTQIINDSLRLRRSQLEAMLKIVLSQHTNYLGIYTAWEPNAFDMLDSNYAGQIGQHPKGAFVPYYYRNGDGSIGYEPLKYYLTEGKGDYYLIPKKNGKRTIIEPIKYKIGDRETFLLTSVVPIVKDNTFYGVVGVDISTQQIEANLKKQTLLDGQATLHLFTQNNLMVATSAQNSIDSTSLSKMQQFQKSDTSSTNGITYHTSIIDGKIYIGTPLIFQDTDTKWYLIIEFPQSYLNVKLWEHVIVYSLLIVLALLILVLILIKSLKHFIEPLQTIIISANELIKGNLKFEIKTSNVKEIHELNVAFEKVANIIEHITDVCTQIAKGNFSSRAQPTSEKDQLAKSVNIMIDALKSSKDEQATRQWSNQGYAKALEIIQQESNFQTMCDKFLQFIYEYLDAHQAKIYMVNNESDMQTKIELISTFAFSRKKYPKSESLLPGEGLVGQAYLEKDAIYMTQVPENYTYITSGLGDAAPRNVMIIPVLYNNVVIAVVEIASFKIYSNLEKELIEKCCNALGAALSTISINDRTKKLLETAQIQAEQMKSQEEEMRQNMEELHATQEEMQRKQKESDEAKELLETLVNHVQGVLYRTEAEVSRPLQYINQSASDLFGYSAEDILSQKVPLSMYIHPDDLNAIQASLSLAIETHSTYELHYRLRHTNAQYIPVRDTGKVIYDNAKNRAYLVGHITREVL
ncbi:MAG: PAS domain-containing protein [Cytophagales bacterium]|nr:PAS domain-containing protein [Cytophagales bacterium]